MGDRIYERLLWVVSGRSRLRLGSIAATCYARTNGRVRPKAVIEDLRIQAYSIVESGKKTRGAHKPVQTEPTSEVLLCSNCFR